MHLRDTEHWNSGLLSLAKQRSEHTALPLLNIYMEADKEDFIREDFRGYGSSQPADFDMSIMQ